MIRYGDLDAAIVRHWRASFRNDVSVHRHLSSEDQRSRAFPGRDQAAVDQCDVEATFRRFVLRAAVSFRGSAESPSPRVPKFPKSPVRTPAPSPVSSSA
jgi:hypothetical protein